MLGTQSADCRDPGHSLPRLYRRCFWGQPVYGNIAWLGETPVSIRRHVSQRQHRVFFREISEHWIGTTCRWRLRNCRAEFSPDRRATFEPSRGVLRATTLLLVPGLGRQLNRKIKDFTPDLNRGCLLFPHCRQWITHPGQNEAEKASYQENWASWSP